MQYAKMYAALIGAAVTAVLGLVGPDNALFNVLTIVAVVCTAIVTYAVPNTPPTVAPAPPV